MAEKDSKGGLLTKVLFALVIILLVTNIVTLSRMNKLGSAYETIFQGMSQELYALQSEVQSLEDQLAATQEQ